MTKVSHILEFNHLWKLFLATLNDKWSFLETEEKRFDAYKEMRKANEKEQCDKLPIWVKQKEIEEVKNRKYHFNHDIQETFRIRSWSLRAYLTGVTARVWSLSSKLERGLEKRFSFRGLWSTATKFVTLKTSERTPLPFLWRNLRAMQLAMVRFSVTRIVVLEEVTSRLATWCPEKTTTWPNTIFSTLLSVKKYQEKHILICVNLLRNRCYLRKDRRKCEIPKPGTTASTNEKCDHRS